MTGIAGLYGPDEQSIEALNRACASVPWRGTPRIASYGALTIALLDSGDGWADWFDAPDALTILDGRFDAALSPAVCARTDARTTPAARFDAVLSALGEAGLDFVAGDFALARWDRRQAALVLARDAFGRRPLYYACKGRGVAFATDVDVLIALGYADGSLQRDRVAAYLACRDFGGKSTGFSGIQRVLGGGAVRVDSAGLTTVRWFNPARVTTRGVTLDDAAAQLQTLLPEAAACRVGHRRSAVLLSGGRDSSSVALATAKAHVDRQPVCVTYVFDKDLPCNEAALAEEVARTAGFECYPIAVPSQIDRLEDVAAFSGPLTFPAWPMMLCVRDVVASLGAESLLDGEGGEPLFAAGPVAALDELRRGRIGTAMAVARAYPARWRWGYTSIAKALARSVVPNWAMHVRDHFRPVPVGVVGAPPASTRQPRSARDELVEGLLWLGETPMPELWDRILAPVGARISSPLTDRRIVDLAMSLPSILRTPIPEPKPVLARAWLGPLASTRRKTSFVPYFERMAGRSLEAFPGALGSDSLIWQQGFVDAAPPGPRESPTWWATTLFRLAVEGWLRADRGRESERRAG